ncbi:MAG: hypothetical protein ABW185_17995 [Sedimenticola sp.]
MWKQLPADGSDTSYTSTDVQYVIDGGALLHRIPWNNGETYDTICSHYTRYVSEKYNRQAVIVFDGYESGPSTKYVAHGKRAKSSTTVPVHFTKDMICSMKKDELLSSTANKQRFINLLSDNFEQKGYKVLHADADADLLMVQTAIKSGDTRTTVLVGDDTDLLVLLLNQACQPKCDIFFRPEPKLNSKKTPRCWNIKPVQGTLGKKVCDNLPFAHAILGCDTTSRVFGIGKPVALKKLVSSEYFRQQAAVYCNTGSTKNDVEVAGENALVCLYNGKPGERLDVQRHQRFCQKVSSSTSSIHPRGLPPTSSAAKYHSHRVYHQVQQWNGTDMNAEEWGWKINNDRMCPVHTDMKPAPAALLEAVNCNCKSDCSTRRCSCRKYGLDCSAACGECKGLHCTNVTLLDQEIDSDDDIVPTMITDCRTQD